MKTYIDGKNMKKKMFNEREQQKLKKKHIEQLLIVFKWFKQIFFICQYNQLFFSNFIYELHSYLQSFECQTRQRNPSNSGKPSKMFKCNKNIVHLYIFLISHQFQCHWTNVHSNRAEQ